jgi:hypothetical protein
MTAPRVQVSVTIREPLLTTTIMKDSLRYTEDIAAGLLYDIIDLARADMRVPEEDVWIFGSEDDPDGDT